MRVLILGATGPCGTLLVKEALDASHTVVIYARSPDKLPESIKNDARVTVLKGELDNEVTLSTAMQDIDGVFSALGPGTPSGGYPDGEPLARGYSLVIKLMMAHGIKRLIALGGPSIPDPHDKSSWTWFLLVGALKTAARTGYNDIVAIGNTIRTEGADLDWTVVRVPFLNNSSKREVVAGYVGDGRVGMTLSRASFAAFVSQEFAKNEWIKAAPIITN